MKNKVCFLMQTPRQFITGVFVGFVDVGKDSAASQSDFERDSGEKDRKAATVLIMKALSQA